MNPLTYLLVPDGNVLAILGEKLLCSEGLAHTLQDVWHF